MASLLGMIRDGKGPNKDWLAGIRAVIGDETLDPAYRAPDVGPAVEQSDLARALAEAGTTST